MIKMKFNNFFTKKNITRGCFLYFVFATIFMIIATTFILEKAEEWAGTIQDDIRYYTLRRFNGSILKKFINREDHMRKTLVLEQRENGISTLQNEVFPFDDSGFYDYVAVGDSLVKNEGDLFATVYREGAKDTVIHFKFKNYETGEVFPKE